MTGNDWISDYFTNRWAGGSGRSGFTGTSAEELVAWQTGARGLLRKLLRMSAFQRSALRCDHTETIREEGYTRDECLLYSEQDYSIPLSILRPNESRFNDTIVIALHGHQGGGRAAVTGDRSDPVVSEAIDEFNYDYGRQLALRGFTVYCPDSRGFGDRRSNRYEGDVTSCNCRELSNVAESLGMTLQGMFVWDIDRIAELIEHDHGDVRVACVGFSGGGMQTLHAAALIERISIAVVSGYFYGFQESLLELYGNCSCNYLPELWRHFDLSDLATLIAPRSLFVESGIHDDLNGESGIDNVTSQVQATAHAYGLIGAADRFHHRSFDGPHRFFGTEAFDWLETIAR